MTRTEKSLGTLLRTMESPNVKKIARGLGPTVENWAILTKGKFNKKTCVYALTQCANYMLFPRFVDLLR